MSQPRDQDGRFMPRAEDSMMTQLTAEWGVTQRTLGQQGQAIENLADAQKRTADSIERLIDKLDKRTTPNLIGIAGVVLTAIGVMITFIVLYSDGPNKRLDRIEKNAEAIADSLKEHTSNGHPFTVIERTERNRAFGLRLESEIHADNAAFDHRLRSIEASRFGRADWESERGKIDERFVRSEDRCRETGERLSKVEAELSALRKGPPWIGTK